SPLHLAAEQGEIGIVKMLLDVGADLNIRENNERYPVHYECSTRCCHSVKFIERGASVNAAADDIVQPVHLATEYTIADIMRILLQFAADAKPTSKKESS
ncbi:hypothetical protein CAPTEDRAFT_88786, partial [Capitella teleta]